MRGDGCLQAELALAKTEACDLCDFYLRLKDHVLACDPHVHTALTNILGNVSRRQKHYGHREVGARCDVQARGTVETQADPFQQLHSQKEQKEDNEDYDHSHGNTRCESGCGGS